MSFFWEYNTIPFDILPSSSLNIYNNNIIWVYILLIATHMRTILVIKSTTITTLIWS